MNSDGLLKCKDVLENYVSFSVLECVFKRLCFEESLRKAVSEMAEYLRELNYGDLVKIFFASSSRRIKKFVAAEVFYRSVLASVIRRISINIWPVLKGV